jgi:hypothetical protein
MKLSRRSDPCSGLAIRDLFSRATYAGKCTSKIPAPSVDAGKRLMAQDALLFATLIFATFVLAGLVLIVNAA